ncbi:MAG: glycosyltransferase [Nitrospirae bacterium]|nr:glycosyltransferase [Nitrospirota bacterium]
MGEDGAEKTIHSLYDPWAEATSIVGAFEFDGKGMLVVLGLGLGYHVAELVKKFPDAQVLVVEAHTEIYELARGSGVPLWNVEFIVGLSSDEALREITGRQMKEGIKPVSVFALSSEVSAFPSYYQPIFSSLKKTASVKLWERLRYPKFSKEKLNVLLIDSGYFLVREIEKALASLGHDVVKFPVKNYPPVSPLVKGGVESGYDNEGLIRRIVEATLKFKPDFILTMNHLGFDETGALTSFFKSIEMPVASWYVDSPGLIVRAFEKNVSPYATLFLWDRTYIEEMKAAGFESVEYLPLGTDESIFKPGGIEGYSCDAGFVANSMIEPVNKWLSKFDKAMHPLIARLAEEYAGAKDMNDENMNTPLAPLLIEGKRLSEKEKMDFEAAVLWKATLIYRLSCIRMFEDVGLHVHGDKGWEVLLDSKKIKLLPPLNYYKELPRFYNACKINFNATSLQMREAVNQRVFDVPSCGAFLLTDYQKSLDGLFDIGNEIVVYKHKDEIPGLVKFYLGHSEKRDEIARRGRERVLKEHTYKHRIGNLIQVMKKRYS